MDEDTRSRAVPLYQSAAFTFASPEHAAALFELEGCEGLPSNIYTRIANPTTEVLEKRLAAMDGAQCGVAVASGIAAISLAVLNLTRAGQNIVSDPAVYGGTATFFQHTLQRFGIEVRWADFCDPKAVEKAMDPQTRLVYCETISNPKNQICDIAAISALAHQHGIPMLMDNTCAPGGVDWVSAGVDIAVYSMTKYIGGHGTSIGGMILDSGRFDWNGGRFPEFTSPDPAYHGLIFREHFGNACFAARIRCCLLRDMGACLSPFNAWLFIQGLETLGLRWTRICETALKIAQWLETHPSVSWVNYPGLPSSLSYANAQKYLNGCGGIIGFGIRGGREAGQEFLKKVKLCSHAANIADSHTLVTHPASTTHQQLTPQELAAAGVTDDFVRLAVGLENAEDIIADLEQALSQTNA